MIIPGQRTRPSGQQHLPIPLASDSGQDIPLERRKTAGYCTRKVFKVSVVVCFLLLLSANNLRIFNNMFKEEKASSICSDSEIQATDNNNITAEESGLDLLLKSSNDTSWILKENRKDVLCTNEELNSNENGIGIPRMIYKILLKADGKRAELANHTKRQREALASWTTRNPGYNMTIFGLDDSRVYLRKYFHPVFLRTFDCINAYAGKANLFRAAVIYREGGWYSDWMEEVKVDGLLDNLRSNGTTIVFPWAWTKDHEKKTGSIMNGFFGAQPRHPMLADTLKILVLNVQAKHYGTYPHDNTGQGVMGRGFKKYYKDRESAKTAALPVTTGRFNWFDHDYKFLQYSENAGIIKHVCDGCKHSEKETWSSQKGNNNYRFLHRVRKYYCPRANEVLNFTGQGLCAVCFEAG